MFEKLGLTWNTLFNILYLLCVLFILIILLFIAAELFAAYQSPSKDFIHAATFGLILTGITFSIGSSIIIPQLNLRRSVEEQVNEKLSHIEAETNKKLDTIKNEIEKNYREKSLNEVHRVDAHLSRMTSYLLLTQTDDAIWPIGWILRSTRRYIKLDASGIGAKEYNDLLVLLNSYSDICLEKIFGQEADFEKAQQNLLSELKKDVRPTLFRDMRHQDEEKIEEENIRKSIRLLKDYFDLELIFRNEVDRLTKGENSNRNQAMNGVTLPAHLKAFFDILSQVSLFVLLLIKAILSDDELKEHLGDLTSRVLEISYSEIWENIDAKSYRTSLKKLMKKIDSDNAEQHIAARWKQYTDKQPLHKMHLVLNFNETDLPALHFKSQ